jgi:hypothetical protein
MNERIKKQPDNIDRELSRIYFGGGTDKTGEKTPEKPSSRDNKSEHEAGKKTAERENGKTPLPPEEKNPPPSGSARGMRSLLLISTVSLALIVAVFAGVRFLTNKRLVFSVDLKEIVLPEKTVRRQYPGTGAPPSARLPGGKTLHDFENTDDGWGIPAWASEKPDHVASAARPVKGISSSGEYSLEVLSDFPGERWSASLIDIQQYLDLSDHSMISADIFLPREAPSGLRAKMILTVGENWRFVEMARTRALTPGQWTTLTADLSDGSGDWKRTEVNRQFREDVRKIALRVESNRKPRYSGPYYVDNITIYTPSSTGREK